MIINNFSNLKTKIENKNKQTHIIYKINYKNCLGNYTEHTNNIYKEVSKSINIL